MRAFPPAEIEDADLAGLALDLALWGAKPEELPFLTLPHPGAYSEAQALLTLLGALDDKGLITDHGRKLAALPLHPRLGHMLTVAGPKAAPLAAIIAERDILIGAPADLSLRLEALSNPKRFAATRPYGLRRPALARVQAEAKRLAHQAQDTGAGLQLAEMAALAYPDRIGQRRKGDAPRFVLSGGKGAVLDPADPLGQSRFIVATDLDGNPREARIRSAITLSDAEIRSLMGKQIVWQDVCQWSRRERRVETRARGEEW